MGLPVSREGRHEPGQNYLFHWAGLHFVAVLATWEPASAQTSEPILSVEVRTQNAGIMRIAMDPANRLRVTGCEDKTVRLWHISGRGEPPSGERAGHGPAPLEGGGGNH